MEQTSKNQNSLFSKIITDIYGSIQENALESDRLFSFSNILELTNKIIIIDIIFNYRRKFKNLYFFIYFIAPTFYFELINNTKLFVEKNAAILDKKKYQKDQISLIVNEYFKLDIHEQKDYLDYKKFSAIYLFILLFMIFFHFTKTENCFVKLMKKISKYIIYFTFFTFSHIFLLIFNRGVFVQFSDSYDKIKIDFILDILLFFIFNLLSYFFYSLLIYAYGQNESFYFLSSKLFLADFALNELGSFLIILRINIKYSILFQLIWSAIFIYDYLMRISAFRNSLHQTSFQKLDIFLQSVVFSLFIVRLISLFLIKYLYHENIFKILECILIALVLSSIYLNFNTTGKCIRLTKLKNLLLHENPEFFKGIYQLLSPLLKFFASGNNSNKPKYKENFLIKYREDIKTYFCLSKEDYMVLCNNNEKSVEVFFNSNRNSKKENLNLNISMPDNNVILVALLELVNKFYKISKEKSSNFSQLVMETLIYNKVILYTLMDEKIFRAQYYLKKFFYSQKFKNANSIIRCIFYYLNSSFTKLEKKNDESSMEYIIYFHNLNIEYLNIVNSFKFILKGFNNSQKQLLITIDRTSVAIGKALDKIIDMIYSSKDSLKIKEQPENEKFKLVEDILFNTNFDKSFEFFDLNSLDSIVEKNNFFLIMFEMGKFTIKKVPLTYYELTGIKTSKMINSPSINIYPYIMRKSQEKLIRTSLLNKKILKEECVLETSENYIINTKLSYNFLPTFQGQLYLLCSLDPVNFPNDCNHVLMQSNGICLHIGYFFKTYFSFNNQMKKLNFLTILGIKEYNPANGASQTFSVTLHDFVSNIKLFLVRDSVWSNPEIIQNIKKIRENFKNLKKLRVIFNFKKKFATKGDEVYLIQIIFEDIQIKNITANKNFEKEETGIILTPNNGSMAGSHSGASVLSYKIIKESSWNITNKNKESIGLAKNTIDRISFIYNLFLVVLAIAICVLIKYFSNQFFNEYIKMIVLREMDLIYFQNVFYVINMIQFEGSGEQYQSLNDEYKKEIEGYNISLNNFYHHTFKEKSVLLLTTSNYFKNNYSNLKTSSDLYKAFNENPFPVLRANGEFSSVNYYYAFDLPKNYFYILSQQEDFNLTIPILNYDNISYNLNRLDEIQQYVICIFYNTFNFFSALSNVLARSKETFKNALTFYKVMMYCVFIVFLCLNICSIILLYLSIEMTNKKMYSIIEKIMKLTQKWKNFLEKKLKFTKLIIKNELKPTFAIEKLKEINPQNKIKSIQTNQQQGINPMNVNPNDDDQDDMYLIPFKKNQKKKIFHFISYCEALKTLFLLGSIYLIFIVITFPIMTTLFNKLNVKRKQTQAIQDLQEILLCYYFGTRLSIGLNSTTIHSKLDLFGGMTNSLFGNHTESKKLLLNDKNKEMNEYLNKINEEGNSCNYLIKDSEFRYALLLVCSKEPLLQTKVETMISGFVNQLRTQFLNYNQTSKTSDRIIEFFHSRTFQFNNLQVIIFFMNYLNDLEYEYTLPDLQSNINTLMIFLVVMFVIIVVTEIVYYISSNIFVLGKMSSSLNDYKVIEKFFSYEESTNNKK